MSYILLLWSTSYYEYGLQIIVFVCFVRTNGTTNKSKHFSNDNRVKGAITVMLYN